MGVLRVGPRVELWSDLAAAGGVRRAFVAGADVVALATSAALDQTDTCTLELVGAAAASGRLAPALAARAVVRLDALGGPLGVREYVVQSVRRAPTEGRVRVTATHPLVAWGTLGPMRTTLPSADGLPGRTDWGVGGLVTAVEALDAALAWVAARGRTGLLGPVWVRGQVDAAGLMPKPVTGDRVTPLAWLRQVAQTWGLEVGVRRLADGRYAVDLVTRVGGAAPVLRLRGGDRGRGVAAGGALTGVVLTEDAGELATSVVVRGAPDPVSGEDTGLARALWRVAAVGAGTAELRDPRDAARGPVLTAGAWPAGTVLQTPAGVRVYAQAVAAPGTVTVADASVLAVGDLVSVRADLDGRPVTALTHPAGLAAYGLAEAELAREDLGDTANLIPNPLGQPSHPDAARFPWASTAQALGLVGAPAGCPVDAVAARYGGLAPAFVFTGPGQAVTFPRALAVDPRTGDDVVSVVVVLFAQPLGGGTLRKQFSDATGAGSDPKLRLVVDDAGAGALPTAASDAQAAAALQAIESWSAGEYLALGLNNIRLSALARVGLTLRVENGTVARAVASAAGPAGTFPRTAADLPGGGLRVVVAGVQVTRTPAIRPVVEGSDATARWLAALDALAARGASPPVTLEAGFLDLAQLDPATYGDQPAVLGGVVQVAFGQGTDSDGAPAPVLTGAGRITRLDRDELVPTGARATLGPPPATLSASAGGAAGRDGVAGTSGTDGQTPEFRYAETAGGPWHPVQLPPDRWAQTRVPPADWGPAYQVAARDGLDGVDGGTPQFWYRAAASAPSTPSADDDPSDEGWAPSAPAGDPPAGQAYYVTSSPWRGTPGAGGVRTGPWEPPVRWTGRDGRDGADAPGAAFASTSASPVYNGAGTVGGVIVLGFALTAGWGGASVTATIERLDPGPAGSAQVYGAVTPGQFYYPEYPLKASGTETALLRVTFTATLPGGAATSTAAPVFCPYQRGALGESET